MFRSFFYISTLIAFFVTANSFGQKKSEFPSVVNQKAKKHKTYSVKSYGNESNNKTSAKSDKKCPHDTKRKKKNNGTVVVKGKPNHHFDAGLAQMEKREHPLKFDVVHLDEFYLRVPAFKQFENNKTDFTEDGNEDFEKLVGQIKDFLKYNTKGAKVTLHIKGSASQIPTSFDPEKPNNNLNPDGSSISGQTSVENNLKLAYARAKHLAERIKAIFPDIIIDIPEQSEITLGSTVWTNEHQNALNEAFLEKDTAAIEALFEPFQKEQFVQVESNAAFVKTTEPKEVRMYSIAAHPRFVETYPGGQHTIHGAIIVSRRTYDMIGNQLVFNSAQERDEFLQERGIELVKSYINGTERWFLISTLEEKRALEIRDEYKKIAALYKLGLVNYKDHDVLHEIVTNECLVKNLYTFTLKSVGEQTSTKSLTSH